MTTILMQLISPCDSNGNNDDGQVEMNGDNIAM